MKVIICGAGEVGYNIAKRLSAEQNDVTVIDRDPQQVHRSGDTLEVKTFIGYGSHPDVLERAGARSADMIIAVTRSDEVNMVACQVAHSLFDLPMKVARIRTQSYLEPIWQDLFSRDNMPIDVIISPEIEVARAIARRLEAPGAFDVTPFVDDRVRLVGLRITQTCPVIDTPLRQLTELFPDLNIVVIGIERDGRMIVPRDEDDMRPGDSVYYVAKRDHVERSLTVFGYEEKEAHRLTIVGGGNVGTFLAQELEAAHKKANIKIIERDEERAEIIADQLEHSTVLSGDALDEEILIESNVHNSEAIIAVTNDDQVNILAALLAKRLGCRRAISLINNSTYAPLTPSLGIDIAIEPRATTVSTILQHVRRGRIRALYSLADGEAEVIEAEALETSPLINQPLRDLDLPKGIIIGAVLHNDEVIIPRGDTVIRAHDRVVLMALSNMIRQVETLFSVRLEYF